MANCEHCGQPMVTHDCNDCDAYGYYYGRDETGVFTPVVCTRCGGAGKVQRCDNRECPSQRWYPASAREQSIVRMVRGVGGNGE